MNALWWQSGGFQRCDIWLPEWTTGSCTSSSFKRACCCIMWLLSDLQWKVIWRQITAGVWAFGRNKQVEPVITGRVWFAPTRHFQQSWRPQQQTKQQTSLKEEEEKEEEKEEAEVPTLVPTVISWWTLLWRKDSVLEAAGRKTQKNNNKIKGKKIKG